MFLMDKRLRRFFAIALLPVAFWRGEAALSKYVITEVWVWLAGQLFFGLLYYVMFWIAFHMIVEAICNVVDIVNGEPKKQDKKTFKG